MLPKLDTPIKPSARNTSNCSASTLLSIKDLIVALKSLRLKCWLPVKRFRISNMKTLKLKSGLAWVCAQMTEMTAKNSNEFNEFNEINEINEIEVLKT